MSTRLRQFSRSLSAAAISWLAAVFALGVFGPYEANAQTLGWWLSGAQAQEAPDTPVQQPPDYEAWAVFATRVENATDDGRTTNLAFDQLRMQLADWRERFLSAQNTNRSRIDTIRGQIAALGAAPAEGETEPAEIAGRRAELTEQLGRLQAPGIAAEEAYRRADGLIREIDTILRDRQTDEFLRLWPAPINPANWPQGLLRITEAGSALYSEVSNAWASPAQRSELRANLPLIVFYLAFAAVLIARGRRWMERLTQRLEELTSTRGRDVWALVVSLGQILLPTAGVYALAEAIRASGMVGLLGDAMVQAMPVLGVTIFSANWLGARLFPKGAAADAMFHLAPERRAEGRIYFSSLGFVVAIDILRNAVLEDGTSDAAAAVLIFPIIAIGGVLLFRTGQLLLLHSAGDRTDGEAPGYRNRLLVLFGRGAMLIGAVAPVLAAIGYVAAASAMVFPAIMSLALFGLLLIVQRLVGDVYALLSGADDSARDALVPVLVGFTLTLFTIPVLALIWGARVADLTEMWARFREGFTLGEARISPSDFVLFAIVFAVGYALTRLVQGALKTSVLPKTSLDTGGQNAIVAGLGYIGIFLSGLIAITSAGIDLSSLAIVAGALSVGIGFGLQNIVSNFVSGIILLVERPVSEGDWIEVGGVMGTVKAISVRSTRIQTFDRTDVIVPNSDLIAGQVTNWTRFNLSGRLILKVGVAYGSDTRKVEGILREIAEAQPLAVLNPPPNVLFMGFGADSLDFEIRMILRDVNFSLSVRSDVNHEIARRFAQEGIEIPFAQRDVWLRNPEVLPGAASPGRAPSGADQQPRRDAPPRADETTVEPPQSPDTLASEG